MEITNIITSAIVGGIVGGFVSIFRIGYQEVATRKRELMEILLKQRLRLTRSKNQQDKPQLTPEEYNETYVAFRTLVAQVGPFYQRKLKRIWIQYVGPSSDEEDPFSYFREDEPGYVTYGHFTRRVLQK